MSLHLQIGDLLSPEQKQRYRTTSPRNLSALLTKIPPSAILVGFEGELDEPLIIYATRHGYTAFSDIVEGATIYVKQNNSKNTDKE